MGMFDDLGQQPAPQKSSGMFADLGNTPNPDDFLPDTGIYKFLPKGVNAAIVSTGREFDKLAKGAESGWLRLTGQDKELEALRAEERSKDAAFKPLADARPGATLIGSMVPYLAIPAGSFASVPAAALGTVAPKAAAAVGKSMILDGALQGAVLGQLRQGDDTSALGGAIGGAVGGALGRGVQKLLSPNMGALTAQQQGVVESVKPLGARMTPGQMTGNESLKRLEAGLESNPVTAFAMRGVKESNQKAVNRAASKAIGETADSLDATVLANAEDRIGSIYKLVRTPQRVDLSNSTQKVTDIIDEARNLVMNPSVFNPRSHQPDPLVSKTLKFLGNGGATQEELVSLSSQLGKRGKSMMTSASGDRDLGHALFGIKDVVDDALESSLSGRTRDAFASARGEYRNLMQLYQRGVVNEQTGDVNAKILANTLASKDRKGFRLGQNQSDLYNMARFTRAFPSIVGDSGTATRVATPLLGGAAAGGLGGAMLNSNDPMQGAVQGAKLGLLGMGVPMVAAKAYMSPAAGKYLGNEMFATGMPNEILRRLSVGAPMGLLGWQAATAE